MPIICISIQGIYDWKNQLKIQNLQTESWEVATDHADIAAAYDEIVMILPSSIHLKNPKIF